MNQKSAKGETPEGRCSPVGVIFTSLSRYLATGKSPASAIALTSSAEMQEESHMATEGMLLAIGLNGQLYWSLCRDFSNSAVGMT